LNLGSSLGAVAGRSIKRGERKVAPSSISSESAKFRNSSFGFRG
jgi:hypothetical protein